MAPTILRLVTFLAGWPRFIRFCMALFIDNSNRGCKGRKERKEGEEGLTGRLEGNFLEDREREERYKGNVNWV